MVCFAASATSRSRRLSRVFPAGVIRLMLRRRSLASVCRATSPSRSRPETRRVRSESRVTIRSPISVHDSPPRPAARRIRRTLYWEGESPAAVVIAVERSAASHAARTKAISTSSSRESWIAIAAAGVGTDMNPYYSSRGVIVKAMFLKPPGTHKWLNNLFSCYANRDPDRRRRPNRPCARALVDATRYQGANHRQDHGGGHHLPRARRAGAHARVLPPGRVGRSSHRGRSQD